MHISITALFWFTVGLALHVLAQVDAVAKAKNNPMNTRMEVFRHRLVPILIRSAWSYAVFILWLQGQLADTLTALGIQLPEIVGKTLDLHVGGALGFGAGYAFDSAIGYIPWLKGSVPPPIDQFTTNIPPPKDA